MHGGSHRLPALGDRGGYLPADDVQITLFFSDRDPIGPYRFAVPARRALRLSFDELEDPAPVPRDTDYASVIESDVPIVVQHTRTDSSTIAYAGD